MGPSTIIDIPGRPSVGRARLLPSRGAWLGRSLALPKLPFYCQWTHERAIFVLVGRQESNPHHQACQAGVFLLDYRLMSVRGVGVEPTLSRSQGGRITAFLPPERVDRRGIAPRFPPCDSGVFLFDQQPIAEVRPGIEPGLPRLPGWRAATTLPDLRVAEAGFVPASA
jgi:hypothetical protein